MVSFWLVAVEAHQHFEIEDTSKMLTTEQAMIDSLEKCNSVNRPLKMKHCTNVERLTEYPDKDGLIIVILYQVNLRNLFLPWFQLLLYTFHKKFRHCAPAITDKEAIINNTFQLAIIHVQFR